MKDGAKIAIFGIASGIAGALALTHLLASLLFEVKPTDPATFAGVAILLAFVVLAACYIPARRAVRGSYGRLEIRVVLRASDWQPFLRTSWHKRLATSCIRALRKSDLWTVPIENATRRECL